MCKKEEEGRRRKKREKRRKRAKGTRAVLVEMAITREFIQ
jgi:hypothetical protein